MTRYTLQRATTLEVLTYDATVVSHDQLSKQLSKSGSVTLTLKPDVVTEIASDGLKLYDRGRTIVTIEETPGQIEFRGIVTRVNLDAAEKQIQVASMGAYPYGIPYEGPAYYGAQIDPTSAVRRLWNHVQSYADSNFGVTVVGATNVRIGSTSTQALFDATAAADAANTRYSDENATLSALRKALSAANKSTTPLRKTRTDARAALTAAKKTKDPAQIAAAQRAYDSADAAVKAQEAVNARGKQAVDDQAAVVDQLRGVKDAADRQKQIAATREQNDGGAWKLLPWDGVDCGRKIDELVDTVPLEWTERHYWDGDDMPQTQIVVHYPRAGRRLDGDGDPKFEQGTNVVIPVAPDDDDDEFANSLYAIGAGEGAGALRRSITRRDGRVRRVKTYQAKNIRVPATLESKLRVELQKHREVLVVDTVRVIDHENSRRGTYNLGDDVEVVGKLPHFGDFSVWHRIVGMVENNDGTTDVQLERTDSFTYGNRKGLDE